MQLLLPCPVVSSFDLYKVEAFSVARIFDGELEFLTDIQPSIACEML